MGEGQIQEGDVYCLEIKEQEEYNYLVIWFSGIKGYVKTHVKNAIRKAKRLKGMIKNATTDTYLRAGLVTKLWEALAIHSMLYGVEVFDMAKSDKHNLGTVERQVGRWAIGGEKWTGYEALYGDLGWISLENRITEKKLVFAGRVALLEQERWARQARNMAEEKGLPWMSKIIALTEEVGLEGASLRLGQSTWKMEVKSAVAERDRRKWEEGMGNKSMLEKYLARSLGLRNRTGRTVQDKTCQ